VKSHTTQIRPATRGFTLVEVMISMTIVSLVMGLALSTFIFCLRVMYKDSQRLATNASLRSFMAQISKETLDASYFYLFPYYTSLDGSVNLSADDVNPIQYQSIADDDYPQWVAHGDCLVLVTKTSLYRNTDIRQIRIYYRVTTNQATVNAEAPIRYYETADWGEGPAPNNPDPTNANPTLTNGHPISGLATALNAINLNANPLIAGSKLLNARSKGRKVPPSSATGTYPNGAYVSGDLYPMFSTDSPSPTATTGFLSINVEFINGSTINNLLSSSSFNYTISPRR
jgi:prepilin-type N-terminal cleavage/methylation domain-containing protein